jgi:hypothetical protein
MFSWLSTIRRIKVVPEPIGPMMKIGADELTASPDSFRPRRGPWSIG